jgi:PEP-CTERM/exosortase A-associated glycosyltransferase
MSLRILHVLDHSLPLQSGYAFRSVALLREQRAMGWETFHVTTPKHYAAGAAEEEVAGLHFFRTIVPRGGFRRAPVLNVAAVVSDTAKRIEELLPRISPNVIHAHSPCLNGLAALYVARRRDIPIVYEMRANWEDAAVDHGTTSAGSLRYRLSRWLETFVVARADALVTICSGLADDIVARGAPRDRITVVPNAVDIEDFEVIDRPDPNLRRELALGEGPVLGFIGSLYSYEGVDALIDAMPRILQAYPDARIVLVGGGPVEAELRRRAAALGVADRTLFVGRVPHEQVRRYYSVIDLLVYARKSTRLTELVTPLKPLEAMSLGRAFIASNVGGHRELIPDYLRANAFVPDDAEDLARVAVRVLKHRESWPALAGAGRRYVSEQCTWRMSAAKYRDAYAAAMQSAGVERKRGVTPA